MTALARILIEEEPRVTVPVARARKLYVVADNATAAEAAPTGNAAVNILLFFAAPFIGLVYVVAFPFVGLAALAVAACRGAAKYAAVRAAAALLRNIGLAVAAPVLGLAYVVLFPFIGLAALAWMGGRAVLAGGAR